MTLTSKTLVKLQTTQHVFTSSVVVEASTKLPASPRPSSKSPLPTFTDQPSSTCVCPSSSAVYSCMKLPESFPVNYSQMPYSPSEANATQIYHLNGTPTISINFFFWCSKNCTFDQIKTRTYKTLYFEMRISNDV